MDMYVGLVCCLGEKSEREQRKECVSMPSRIRSIVDSVTLV